MAIAIAKINARSVGMDQAELNSLSKNPEPVKLAL